MWQAVLVFYIFLFISLHIHSASLNLIALKLLFRALCGCNFRPTVPFVMVNGNIFAAGLTYFFFHLYIHIYMYSRTYFYTYIFIRPLQSWSLSASGSCCRGLMWRLLLLVLHCVCLFTDATAAQFPTLAYVLTFGGWHLIYGLT